MVAMLVETADVHDERLSHIQLNEVSVCELNGHVVEQFELSRDAGGWSRRNEDPLSADDPARLQTELQVYACLGDLVGVGLASAISIDYLVHSPTSLLLCQYLNRAAPCLEGEAILQVGGVKHNYAAAAYLDLG